MKVSDVGKTTLELDAGVDGSNAERQVLPRLRRQREASLRDHVGKLWLRWEAFDGLDQVLFGKHRPDSERNS